MTRFDPARSLPVLTLVLLALAVLATTAPAVAGTTGTTYYTCVIDVSAGINTCTDGVVTVTSSSGNQRVARIDQGSYVRMDAFVDYCNPSAWWIHFADSPTCNGYGGDAGTTQHDAEVQIVGASFALYGNYNSGRAGYDPVYSTASVVPVSGCHQSQWTIYEDHLRFDDDADASDSSLVDVTSYYTFESAPYDEPDSEDPSGADASKWYVGINRTVGSAYRSGSGTNRVCFVLSTTTAPSAATLNSLCP